MRFWFRNGIQTFLWSCVIGMVYILITVFSSGFGASVYDALVAFPYYLLLGTAMFSVLMTSSAYALHLPISLSMGRTRREALLGLHTMTLTPVAFSLAVCLLYCLLCRNDVAHDLLPLLPAAALGLIISTCVGHCMGCASIRFPRFGKVISFIAVMIVCGGAGGIMGWIGSNGTVLNMASASIGGILAFILGGTVLILLAIVLPFQRGVLRRYEVKL